MALYFKDIEITNIDNLVPQTGLDITDMWFGTTNIYTVWAVYDGILPATLNANGSDMRQYQIWGNVGGVGDRTVQLFNPNAKNPGNGYMANTFLYGENYESSENWEVSEYIDISGLSRITLYRVNLAAPNASVVFYTNNHEYLSSVAYAERVTFSTSVPQNAQFCRISVRKERWEMAAVVPGATAPTNYIPYGYGVDISTSDGTAATVMPIYIGNELLGKDEYIDCQAQKIYRMINGVLTPTDPPVALPALPTCEGTTIVDYAGSGTVPEKAFLKYRKENF